MRLETDMRVLQLAGGEKGKDFPSNSSHTLATIVVIDPAMPLWYFLHCFVVVAFLFLIVLQYAFILLIIFSVFHVLYVFFLFQRPTSAQNSSLQITEGGTGSSDPD